MQSPFKLSSSLYKSFKLYFINLQTVRQKRPRNLTWILRIFLYLSVLQENTTRSPLPVCPMCIFWTALESMRSGRDLDNGGESRVATVVKQRVNLQAEWLTMVLLSSPVRKVMEEAQQRGSDLCGRVNMPPLFMQSQAGAGGQRGDPSQRAMSEPLEWPRLGQAAEVGCKERKHQLECVSSLFPLCWVTLLFVLGRGSLESTWLFPTVFPLQNAFQLFVCPPPTHS